VLCIDRGLNCSAEDLPPHARVVWFKKRIEPSTVLAAMEATAPEVAVRLERIALADLFIDWAGRQAASASVHRRLEGIKIGEAVRFRRDGTSISIDAADGPIALLSRPGCARWLPKLDHVVSATLVEKVARNAEQSAPQWRSRLRCNRWTVPVVEVVLAAGAANPPPEP